MIKQFCTQINLIGRLHLKEPDALSRNVPVGVRQSQAARPASLRRCLRKVGLLAVIVIALAGVIAVRITADFQRRFGKIRAFNRTVKRVRFVIDIRVGEVGEKPHFTIFVVMIHRAFGCIDGKCLVMSAETVAVRIGVGKNSCLQHLIR